MPINNEVRAWMYTQMQRSRKFEEALIPLYFEDKLPAFNMRNGPLPGEMHYSFGQEPVGAAVAAAMSDEDMLTGTHRPHHVAIPRGVDLKKMTAEILQRETGLSRGRGGHMHIYDASVNFSGWSIVGGTMGITAGMAMSRKMQGLPGVGVTVIGEGAVNEGHWHEVMNMAGLWKLPFVCVIEDNYYGVTVAKHESTAVARNSDRASAYNCPGEYVENNDADALYEAMQRALTRARNGEGPTIIEVETARIHGHYAGDQGVYIPPEIKEKYLGDALPVYRQRLIDEGVLSEEQAVEIEESATAEVAEAIQFARDSGHLDPSEATTQVFA